MKIYKICAWLISGVTVLAPVPVLAMEQENSKEHVINEALKNHESFSGQPQVSTAQMAQSHPRPAFLTSALKVKDAVQNPVPVSIKEHYWPELQEKSHCLVHTSDDREVFITSLLKESQTLKDLIEDIGSLDPMKKEHTLCLPLSHKVLASIEFITSFDENNESLELFLCAMPLDQFTQVIIALNYLHCKRLLPLALKVFAQKLDTIKCNNTEDFRIVLKELDDRIPQDIMKLIKLNFLVDHKNLTDLMVTCKGETEMPVSMDWLRITSTGRFMIVPRLESTLLFDLSGEIPKKVMKFKAINCVFSPDGKYLFYTDKYIKNSHVLHSGSLIELETLKKITLDSRGCSYECSNFVHAFSADSAYLLLGEGAYDVKDGTYKERSDPEYDDNGDNDDSPLKAAEGDYPAISGKFFKKDTQDFIRFSRNDLREVPEGMKPLSVTKDRAFLMNQDTSYMLKLESNGSSKKIALPPLPSDSSFLRSHKFYFEGTMLIRTWTSVAEPIDFADIIDISDGDNPRILFHGYLQTYFCYTNDFGKKERMVCVLTDTDIMFIKAKTGEINKTHKPAFKSNARSALNVLNRRRDKIMVCYNDGSVYLYLTALGTGELKVLPLPEKDLHKPVEAFFTGLDDESFITRENRGLKVWNLNVQALLDCSLSQIFTLIRCLQDPSLVQEAYYEKLFESLSLSERIKKAFLKALENKRVLSSSVSASDAPINQRVPSYESNDRISDLSDWNMFG